MPRKIQDLQGGQKSFVQSDPVMSYFTGTKNSSSNVEKRLSSRLRSAIVNGRQQRIALKEACKTAAKRASEEDQLRGNFRIDTLISGSSGIGKSHNVKKALKESKIPFKEITGSINEFAFGSDLMVHHYDFIKGRKSPEEKLVILFDDCDSFFHGPDTRNMLKSILGEERKYQYNKMILEHNLSERQLLILPHYRNPNGAHGFTIDTKDIIFIITTNIKFPTEREANFESANKSGGSPRAAKLNDLVAIAGRCNHRSFFLDPLTNWGFLASVCLDDDILDTLDEADEGYGLKMELLDWLHYNWSDMRQHNLRTIIDMAFTMLENPGEYRDIWEAHFLDPELVNRNTLR